MPSFCSVLNCNLRGERDKISFFRFPSASNVRRGAYLSFLSRERRNAWIKALDRGPLTETFLKYARVCARHFITGKPAMLQDKDNPDWIPNQNMAYEITKRPYIPPTIRIKPEIQPKVEPDEDASNLQALVKDKDNLDFIPNQNMGYEVIERPIKRPKISTKPEVQPKDEPDDDASSYQNVECLTIMIVDNDSDETPQTNIADKQDHGDHVSQSVQTDLNMDNLSSVFNELDNCKTEIYSLQKKLKALTKT